MASKPIRISVYDGAFGCDFKGIFNLNLAGDLCSSPIVSYPISSETSEAM
jgi:hypothetical protein